MCHYTSLFFFVSLHQRKCSIFLGRSWTRGPASLSCSNHVYIFSERIKHFYERQNAALLQLPTLSAVPSTYVSSSLRSHICRGNNSDGRRDLSAYLLIIHGSLFVATVRTGWVSNNLCIRLWDSTRTLRMTEGAFVVFRKVDSCAALGMLSARLPPLTRPRRGSEC